jgi:hypothetical protein
MNWKKLLVEALSGFVGWTAALTPYMLLVVKTNLEQYIAWFVKKVTKN